MHRIVHQPFLGELCVGDLAHQTNAACRAPIFARDRGRLDFEPAVGIVGVAHAELGADVAATALLNGRKNLLHPFPVARIHAFEEIIEFGA